MSQRPNDSLQGAARFHCLAGGVLDEVRRNGSNADDVESLGGANDRARWGECAHEGSAEPSPAVIERGL